MSMAQINSSAPVTPLVPQVTQIILPEATRAALHKTSATSSAVGSKKRNSRIKEINSAKEFDTFGEEGEIMDDEDNVEQIKCNKLQQMA